MNKAVFLDRDGTLNEEADYLHECDKLKLIPGTYKALRTLKEKGFLLIVISNQSGVGRGYFPAEDVDKVNACMNDMLAKEGAGLDAFYCCLHAPEEHCLCRKPKTALYLKAAQDFDIDFARSYMVGDKVSDIEAADTLGCGRGLLLSGHDIDGDSLKKYEDCCYKNLLDFAVAVRGDI